MLKVCIINSKLCSYVHVCYVCHSKTLLLHAKRYTKADFEINTCQVNIDLKMPTFSQGTNIFYFFVVESIVGKVDTLT